MSDRILSVQEVLSRVPYSRGYLYELEKKGLFPKRRKIGSGRGGRVGYLEPEIDEWAANLQFASQ